MTLFNYWHFIILGIIFLLLVGGLISAFRQTNKKLVLPMIISTVLITTLMAGFSIVAVDKYTKKVKLYKLKNKRLLSTEQIIYTGIVKNEGNFPIGKVTFEIKLVNKGHMTGNVKGGNFYKPSGFLDFFTSGMGMGKRKPQTITKEFIVAKNLKPGTLRAFRVHFRYPPYFRSTSQFAKVYAH
jgi:hypothetical protein